MKNLARALFDRTWSRGDERAIAELCAPDCVFHDPMLPAPAHGREGYARVVRAYRAAFPNLTVWVEQQIAEEHVVVSRWRATGTHLGDLLGIPPTGRQAEVSGTTISRVVDDMVSETWVHWDRTELFKQLGLVREPAEYPVTAS